MRMIRWVLIGVGALVVLAFSGLLILPHLVDMQDVRSDLERRLSEAAGLPVFLTGNMDMSLFPAASLSVQDVQIGNPPGFEGKYLLTLQSLQIKLRLLPLLSREIQIEELILDRPVILLEKLRDGRINWAHPEDALEVKILETENDPEPSTSRAFLAEGMPEDLLSFLSMGIDKLSIQEGNLTYADRTTGKTRTLSGVMVQMQGFSRKGPMHLSLEAMVSGVMMSAKASVGSSGEDLSQQAEVPLDLAMAVGEVARASLKGRWIQTQGKQGFDVALDIPSFSPRQLIQAMGRDFPVQTPDPAAFERASLTLKCAGDTQRMVIENGLLVLDETTLDVRASMDLVPRPEATVQIQADRADLDRYIERPAGDLDAGEDMEATGEKDPLHGMQWEMEFPAQMGIQGAALFKELRVRGSDFRDVRLSITGSHGVLRLMFANGPS